MTRISDNGTDEEDDSKMYSNDDDWETYASDEEDKDQDDE